MKNLFKLLFAGLILALVASSCVSMKKDCNGNKHYKTKNGIYI